MSLLYRQSKDTVKSTTFRPFRAMKKAGGGGGGQKLFFFILKLIIGHEPDIVYIPQVCFCRPSFS